VRVRIATAGDMSLWNTSTSNSSTSKLAPRPILTEREKFTYESSYAPSRVGTPGLPRVIQWAARLLVFSPVSYTPTSTKANGQLSPWNATPASGSPQKWGNSRPVFWLVGCDRELVTSISTPFNTPPFPKTILLRGQTLDKGIADFILNIHGNSRVELGRHFFHQKILVVGEIAAGMARLGLVFGKESERFFCGSLFDLEYLGSLGKFSTYKQMCR